MSRPEATPIYLLQADSEVELVQQRLSNAYPVHTLSTWGDKQLQVFEEADGQHFVARQFTKDAILSIKRPNLSFGTAWNAMHHMFKKADVHIVPSTLIEQGGRYPFVAVSQYLPDAAPIQQAPVDKK